MSIVTPDLARFRAFYEGTIGLDTAVVFGAGPGHPRRVAVLIVGDVMLHVFEAPGNHTTAPAPSTPMLERGRLDHLGFTVPDVVTLTAIRDRLLAVNASSGDIRPLGPMLSLRFADPDGLESEINCLNPNYDPSTLRAQDDAVDPGWFERITRVLHAGGMPDSHTDRETTS